MDTEQDSAGGARTATHQLVDELRASRLRGEGRTPGLCTAVERAARRLTGAASARLMLDGDVRPPRPDEMPPISGGAVLRIPLPAGVARSGALEVSGLADPPSEAVRAGLELLACVAGVLLDEPSRAEDAGGDPALRGASDRRLAALARSERFLDRMFRANPDAIYVFDLSDRRIVFANRDLGSLAGYSREESDALGRDLLPALLHPDDVALYERSCARYDESSHEEVHETHFRVRHKDGTWRWLLGRGIVFDETPDGHAAQVLAVVKDVTAQKLTEDSLRDSETFHRTLADTVPVGIAMTDGEERITWSSPAFRELVGVESEADVAGSLVTDWIVTGFEGLIVEQRRAPRTPSCLTRPREVRLRRRDGSVLWADLVSAPLFRPGGDFSGAILAVQDTSELRSANETLKKAAERLQLLSRRVVEVQEEERRHVARELHDEIGQALVAILFRMQALLRSPDTAQREVIAETAEIADRTMRSVRDLSLDLHPSLLDEAGLADTLRWYIDRQVRGPGLAVELEACPSLANLPAALRNACFRIAQSALTNVVRHARARRVRVEIRILGGALELVVRDDGVGFDVAATLPHVSSGTSLGLLAMRERAELLDGTIAFESKTGRGTTVTARFPLPEPAAEEGAA